MVRNMLLIALVQAFLLQVNAQTFLWASQPVHPGETVLVWGSGLAGLDHVNVSPIVGAGGIDSVTVSAFDVSNTSFKAIIPATLDYSMYKLCAGSTCMTVNAPDVFWTRGDVNLTYSTLDGYIRIFGRGLAPLPSCTTTLQLLPVLEENRGAIVLQPVQSNLTQNSVIFSLKGSTVAAGQYKLAVVSCGETFPITSESDSDTNVGIINIVNPSAIVWPNANIIHKVNDTTSLFVALNTTRSQGGGTILMARGRYEMGLLNIDLPPYTTLAGVSTAHVSLYWNTEGINNPPSYLIGGNGTFAVENLTIYVTSKYKDIIKDGVMQVGGSWIHSQGVRVKNVRIRADCFYRLQERNAPPRRGLVANFTYEDVGDAINFQGSGYEVINCDIYASGFGINLQYADVGIVHGNSIWYGETAYMIDSSSYIIFEQNNMMGINLFSRGNAGGATYGGSHASFIAFLNNSLQFVFGGDQELMTLDGGYSPFVGRLEQVDGVNITLPVDPVFPQWCSSKTHCQYVHTEWTGSAVYVIQGQGQGQLRVVASGGMKQNRSWTLAKEFGGAGGGVPLGADSYVSIFERREKCLYIGNHFADGGPMQLYGGMFHAVVADNVGVRINGFIVEGLNHEATPNHPHYIPCYFVETMNNRIEEGNNYGGSGNFHLSGYYNASATFHGPMAVAVVYRGNYVNNGAWAIEGAVADVLIEGNTMEDSDSGLQILNNVSERIFLRNNNGL
eukprot:m.236657 g.236657  ORF g.236657 m.236657 type:complete len:728 (+) comp16052_c0_seq16:66-2249(+)